MGIVIHVGKTDLLKRSLKRKAFLEKKIGQNLNILKSRNETFLAKAKNDFDFDFACTGEM